MVAGAEPTSVPELRAGGAAPFAGEASRRECRRPRKRGGRWVCRCCGQSKTGRAPSETWVRLCLRLGFRLSLDPALGLGLDQASEFSQSETRAFPTVGRAQCPSLHTTANLHAEGTGGHFIRESCTSAPTSSAAGDGLDPARPPPEAWAPSTLGCVPTPLAVELGLPAKTQVPTLITPSYFVTLII